MKDLILHPGALGDVLLSLPALSLLKKHWPQSLLTLGGNLDFVGVACHGYADKVISLSNVPLHRLYTDSPLPDEDLRFWNSFDRVVSWTGAGDTRFERRLAETHPAAKIARWKPVPDDRDHRHLSRVFADSLAPWVPSEEALVAPRLEVREEDRLSGQEWLRVSGNMVRGSVIAIHPGAGNAAKRWALPKFKTLARALLQDNRVTLLLIEGPAEPGMASELVRALYLPRVTPAINLPLPTLAALIARCKAFVGNDSGISHLAGALGVPSVVLFGPTDPLRWAPLGECVRVLSHRSGCAACEGAGRLEHTCLGSIAVEEVVAKLSEIRS